MMVNRLRLRIFFTCTLCTVLFFSSATAQKSTRVNYSAQDTNKTLRDAILEIRKQFNVDILFEESVVAGETSAEEEWKKFRSAEDALGALLKDSPLTFKKIKHNTYIIIKGNNSPKSPGKKLPEEKNVEKEPGTGSLVEDGMKKGDEVIAQRVTAAITVSGVVSDEKELPISGASVTIKNTRRGTVTNSDGRFTIEVESENTILVISSVGYETREMAAGNAPIRISLKSLNSTLSDVVVIGYGSQRQRKITGAIGSVPSKDITAVAVTGLDQALQGRLAGVQVTQNSGEPGGGVSIRVRGVGSINSSNEPLYIIDGIPYNSINAINPNDIERIDVLKDAAAASIYGSRGSNGVVLVTTKRGRSGKMIVSFDAYAGVQSIYRKMDLMNGPEFAKAANENLVNAGLPPNPEWSNPSAVQDNDYQSSVLQRAPIQSYNVSIAGGGDKLSTFFSFSYFNQEGIVTGSDYKRYTARLNSDYNISTNLKVGIAINVAFDEKNQVPQNDNGGTIMSANSTPPTIPIQTDHDGFFGLNPDGSINLNDSTFFGWEGYTFRSKYANPALYGSAGNNPRHTTKERYQRNVPRTQQLLAAAFAEYEVIPGLKLRSTINLNFGNAFSYISFRKSPAAIDLMGPYKVISSYEETWNKSQQWNWINNISYSKTINQHNISAVAGIDALKNNFRFIAVNTANLPDAQHVINASDAASRVTTGFPSNFALLSYFGRLSYDYADKYLISLNVRRDGSSKFGPNNKYAVFPSASVGWRISQESFMEQATFVNDLKLRASYGTAGNQNIPDFKYLTTYSNNGGTYQYTLGAEQVPVAAIYADNFGDPDIHWEKSTQTNFGIDAALFSNKISLTADYYIKKLDDLLGNFPVPVYTGVTGGSILRNGFSMENRGVELSLGYNEQIGAVKFSAIGNFSTLQNKILRLLENEKGYIAQNISVAIGVINDGDAQTRTIVGNRIAAFYGYIADGIFQNADEVAEGGMGGVEPGDRRYKDLNKDGIINDQDKTILGYGLPKYIFGLNLSAEFRGFDISVLLNGQTGVQIADMTKVDFYHMHYKNTTGIINGSSDLLRSWTGEGSTNELPRNSYNAPTSNRWFSSFNIQNGSFVRVRNVQLGYTLKGSLLNRLSISRARLYVSAQNLHTFTKYKGYDPEIGSRNQNVLTTGVDFGRYPLPRMMMFGINCQF